MAGAALEGAELGSHFRDFLGAAISWVFHCVNEP